MAYTERYFREARRIRRMRRVFLVGGIICAVLAASVTDEAPFWLLAILAGVAVVGIYIGSRGME